MSTTTQSERSYTTSSKLEDQAASAALHVTKDSASTQTSHPLLDEDGKLSSAGAATSLKYAKPQDLPSFPSVGSNLSSAGAAASLAESNKKSYEPWKPGAIPAANKAAREAKDYQMDPLWQHEISAAGSRAAAQAHRDTASVHVWQAPETEHGQSAAGLAMNRKPTNTVDHREVPADSHRKALLAATASMSGNRRRADSAPMRPQQDVSPSLRGKGDKGPSPLMPFASGDPGFEAARIQNIAKDKVSRQMYGSKPPVAIEVEEQNRQAMLRASAVAMAQKMYAVQQQQIEQAKALKRSESHHAARTVHNRQLSDASSSQDDDLPDVPQFYNLEEAARKLAQERLAKIHDEHAEYREYYGASSPPQKSRLSLRGLGRPRAASDTTRYRDDDDEEQSRKIRTQMSLFQSKLAAVDEKKRQADRDALLAAARKNVDKSLNEMDEKVFADTGKMSPQQRELWEKTARDRAQRDSDERMVNLGKVHIGGGVYMDQSEVDAIARARLQPTLDEISEKAEAQRAKDEEIRLEEEKRKREAETEKTRQAQQKAEERAVAQKEKSDEKARKAEEKRVQREEATIAKNQAAEQKERERLVAIEEKNKRKAEAAAEKERQKAEKEEKRKSRGETRGGRLSNLLGIATAGETAVGGAAAVMGVESAADQAATAEARPASGAEGESQLAKADAADREAYSKEQRIPPAGLPGGTEGKEAEGKEAEEKEDEDDAEDEATGESQLAKADSTNKAAYSKAEGLPPARRPEGTEGKQTEDDDTEAKPLAAIHEETSGESQLAKADETDRAAYSKTEGIPPARLPGSTEGKEIDDERAGTSPPASPSSPGKGDKVRTWFKSRFQSGSKSEKDRPVISPPIPITTESKDHAVEEKKSQDDSMRDVAMAGRATTNESEDMYGAPNTTQKDEGAVTPLEDSATAAPVGAGATQERDPSPVSSISESNYSRDVASKTASTTHEDAGSARPLSIASSAGTAESAPRGRKGFRERILNKITQAKEPYSGFGQPLPSTAAHTITAPTPLASTEEEAQESEPAKVENSVEQSGEANDLVAEGEGGAKDDEELAPPPKMSTLVGPGEGGVTTGKASSPRGSHERSRFTENL